MENEQGVVDVGAGLGQYKIEKKIPDDSVDESLTYSESERESDFRNAHDTGGNHMKMEGKEMDGKTKSTCNQLLAPDGRVPWLVL